MATLRSYIDSGHQLPMTPAPTMTDEQQHEVRCGMCARELFVDDEG